MTSLVQVNVSVEYFGLIRAKLPVSAESVRVASGSTVGQLFGQLATRHGSGICDALLAPRGEPLPNVVLTLNGQRIVDRSGMERAILADGVLRVLQMPPFTGGG